MPTEADTCRKFVVPKLQAAGWDNESYSIAERRTIWIVDAHRGDGKHFVVRADEKLRAFLSLKRRVGLAANFLD